MPLSPLGGALDTAPTFATPTFDINPRPLSKVSPNLLPVQAFAVGDRIKDGATVTPALVTLARANPVGFSNFKDGVGNGNATFYVLTDTTGNWEAQYGVYNDAAGTLTRAAVPLASSGSPGSQVAFSGTISVFGNWPAAALMSTAFGVGNSRFIGPYNRNAGINSLRSNTVFYLPIFIPQAFSSFQIMFSGGVNTNVDVGLYSNRGGAPFQMLGQQTGLNPVVGGQQQTSVISCGPRPPGMHWGAMIVRNGGVGEGSISFSALNALLSFNDVIGTNVTNANYLGYYEGYYSSALPIQASSSLSLAAFGDFPVIPALWVRPII
jgi:hypothetical protein